MLDWQPIETFPRDAGEFSTRFVVVSTSHNRLLRACASTDDCGTFCIHEMSDGFGINRLSKPTLETYLKSEHARWEEDPESYWNDWEVATHWCEITLPG